MIAPMPFTVVLLPGLASDATLWRDQIPALSAVHEVAVTDVHMRCATLPQMAHTLLAEHPGELVLIGTSMGGMVALEALRQAPPRVRGLALLGTSARPDTPPLVELRRAAVRLFEQGRAEELLRVNAVFSFHPKVPDASPLVETYLDIVLRAGADQLIRQNRALMARDDLRPLLPTIACPTLVLCGEADAVTPPVCSRELAQAIPGARLEIVREAGHLLTLEQPERVNALLLEWLATLS